MSQKRIKDLLQIVGAITVTCLVFAWIQYNRDEKMALAKDGYPTRQVHIIVPFTPGGGPDLFARGYQKMFMEKYGKPFVILNKAGGGTIPGYSDLVRSKPDGYTLGLAVPELIFQSVYGQSKYHFLTALEPLAQIASVPQLLLVNAERPWYSVQDLIRYAKDNNEPIRFATSGIGSVSHVLSSMLGRLHDIRTLPVPFKGGIEKVHMLLGNHVDAIYISPGAAREFIKNGKFRVLATTASKRADDPLLVDVPTHKELGIDMVFDDWYGIAVPKPLPPKIKEELVKAFKEMTLSPEYEQAVKNIGGQIDYLGPEEATNKWIEDATNIKRMLHETGIIEEVRNMQGLGSAKS